MGVVGTASVYVEQIAIACVWCGEYFTNSRDHAQHFLKEDARDLYKARLVCPSCETVQEIPKLAKKFAKDEV